LVSSTDTINQSQIFAQLWTLKWEQPVWAWYSCSLYPALLEEEGSEEDVKPVQQARMLYRVCLDTGMYSVAREQDQAFGAAGNERSVPSTGHFWTLEYSWSLFIEDLLYELITCLDSAVFVISMETKYNTNLN
jgi:hypothetical protein